MGTRSSHMARLAAILSRSSAAPERDAGLVAASSDTPRTVRRTGVLAVPSALRLGSVPGTPAPERLPALFVGHGNPMNALADNPYTEAWRELGASLGRPRGVLCISAHWY